MRFLALVLTISLLLTGYCAAAHAFGEAPMQGKTERAAMMGMPDCPAMQGDMADSGKIRHSAKTGSMNSCKLCCMSLVGFPFFWTMNNPEEASLKFSIRDHIADGDISSPIFHPPKSPA